MIVGIDSSHQLLYTGIISGRSKDIDELYEKVSKIFAEKGVANKLHWSKLSNKTKGALKGPLMDALKESERINLNVLEHRKPIHVPRKDWYLRHLPIQIAQRLERWAESKRGAVEIYVDNDYNTGGDEYGTQNFIRSLLRQMGYRLAGEDVSIRNEGILKATIKQRNGNVVTFYGSIANHKSKIISLVDIYLGLYIWSNEPFEGLPNIYYKNIR